MERRPGAAVLCSRRTHPVAFLSSVVNGLSYGAAQVLTTPATDWYFVHKGASDSAPPVVYQVAAWGQKENGEVVGLVGAFGADQAKEGKAPHLVTVPPVAGSYLHREQLTGDEVLQAKKR
ncbi:hypothetical protein PSP6_690105 [Paraburkholderia tropica]|uniref:hypothetical protein n=1 Tax=Paraburkholderia tropica TaxID=92647 RepID=UPI001CAFCEEE|nr:hypothetical protein [Paraburkholderia tropica]CAG9235939.1 hypothetical protein PSP6_690105 [Paraburkholderia tropica]